MSSFDVVLLFSPQNCSPEVLERNLTQDRRALAEKLIDGIRERALGTASRYDLVLGSRGTGKTHLIAYIQMKLLESPKQSPHIVRLSEEELGIVTHVDFLVACLRAENVAIEEMYDELRGEAGHEVAEERFLHELDGRSTLLVVENLASMLDDMNEAEQRRLRSFFQRNSHISVLAASPRLFEDSGKADHPFHGFFLLHRLKQLTRLDARNFLIQLAESKGDDALAEAMRSEKAQARVNAVYDLTGGNHRLLGMLSECLSADDLKTLVEPFVRMVDRELTPYYQQRLFALPAQQAKILRAIARHEVPLTVKEIARLSLASEQTTSSQLRALKEAGLVRSESLGRESNYELQEPLMRMVLDIKEGREKVLPSIVSLLRDWYEVEELQDLAQKYDGFSREYYEAAFTAKLQIVSLSNEMDGSARIPDLMNKLLNTADELYQNGKYEEAIEICDEVVEHFTNDDQPEIQEKLAQALFNKGVAFGTLRRYEDALATYDEVLTRFAEREEPAFLRRVSFSLTNKGVSLQELGRSEEALNQFDEVIRRFSEHEDPETGASIAKALMNKGAALQSLGRTEDAIAVCEEVVARFSGQTEPEVQVAVVGALNNKGGFLSMLGRYNDALAVLELTAERFADSIDTDVQERVAATYINKGAVLRSLDRLQDAVETYEELVQRFEGHQRLDFQGKVAWALLSKGVTLEKSGRSEDAISTFDDVVARFGGHEESEIQVTVAGALLNRCVPLGSLGRMDEVDSTCDEVLSRFDGSEEPALLEIVAKALALKFVIGTGQQPELMKLAAVLEKARESAVYVFSLLIENLKDRPSELREFAGLGELHKELVLGLTSWIQTQLPLSKEDAVLLAETEQNLNEAFGEIEGAKKMLALFSAARAHTLGDKKALLRLPLESRRLVERAYGIGEDD